MNIVNSYFEHFRKNFDLTIIILIMLFISEDTFLFGTNDDFSFILFKYFVYLLLLIYLLAKSKLRIFTTFSKASFAFYGLIFSIIFSMSLNLDFGDGSIYTLWLIILGFLITQKYNSKTTALIYCDLLFFLSLISVMVYTLATMFPAFLDLFPISTNIAGVEFVNMYICVVFFEMTELRNTGIFREPGVFMIYIIIAILFHMFAIREKSNFKLLIYVVALTLTFSTAAYIIIAFLVVIYIFKSDALSAVKNKLLIIFLSIIAVVIIFSNEELYEKIFSKIDSNSSNYGSAIARTASVFVNLDIFYQSPFAGTGVNGHTAAYAKHSLEMIGFAMPPSTNTNTITTLLAMYGFLCGLIVCILIFQLSQKFASSILIYPLIAIIFFLLLSNEALIYSIFFYFILFWGVKTERDG